MPVATISKGEPPPESEFESWLLPLLDVGALLGSVINVGAAPVGSVMDAVDVAVLSRFNPEEEALEV